MEKRRDLIGSDRYEGERYVEVAPPGSAVALSPYTGYYQGPGKATIGEYSRVRWEDQRVRLPLSGIHGETCSVSPTARISSVNPVWSCDIVRAVSPGKAPRL